ncbi:BQ2448_1026 [Microbotryum intermedium]|uniref:BQ2448_1026 protein n=1 Tax=Microbotryum intermedium TaxID=269621 RepID=A0A238F6T8_9BASI|nr:BQ2448_1026 [Microbotryum intermedium]
MTKSTMYPPQNESATTPKVDLPALHGHGGHVVFAESAAPPRTSSMSGERDGECEPAATALQPSPPPQASTSESHEQVPAVASTSGYAAHSVTPDGLPSYAQVEKAEPNNPRFGRWAGWIEKRTRERSQDRVLNTQRSWGSHIGNTDESYRAQSAEQSRDSASSSMEQSKMRRKPTQLPVRAQNRHSWAPTSSVLSGSQDPMRFVSLGGAPAHPLTPSSAIQSLGSRFAQQFEEPPTCLVALSNVVVAGSRAHAAEEGARLLLVGTTTGLSLVDLASPRNEGQMEVLPLWDGLGIVQMDLFDPNVPHESGLLLALVRRPTGGEVELRMWSLTNLLNLVRWRLTNLASSKVSLETPTVLSPTLSSSAEKRRSRPVFKDIFLNKTVGSGRERTSESKSTKNPARGRAADGDFAPDGLRPNASFLLDTSSPQSQLLALPLEWANSSTVLPIPKSGGHISFIKLCQLPVATAPSSSPPRKLRMCLYLIVATSKSIFIYTSSPTSSSSGMSRKWTAYRELYAPATPRFIDLVKTNSFLPSSRSEIPSGASPPRGSHTIDEDRSLLLGMSSNIVLIRLSDSSVHEITVPTLRTRNHRSSSSVSYDSMGRASSSLKMGRSVSLQRKARAGVERAASMLLHYGKNLEAIPAGVSKDEAKTLTTGIKIDETGLGAGALRLGEGLGIGGGDAGWSNYTPIEGVKGFEHAHLFTKGRVTCLVVAPRAPRSTSSSPRLDPVQVTGSMQVGIEASSTAMIVLHAFVWPQAVKHVALSYVHDQPTSTSTNTDEANRIVLLGFSATGVHAQEGHLSLSRATHGLLEGKMSTPPRAIWMPHSAADVSGSEGEAEATLDFGRPIIYLGTRRANAAPTAQSHADEVPAGGGTLWWGKSSIRGENVGRSATSTMTHSAAAECYFAVQGVGDWTLKRVE